MCTSTERFNLFLRGHKMHSFTGPFHLTYQLDQDISCGESVNMIVTLDGRTTPATIQYERNGSVRQIKANSHQQSLISEVVEMAESSRLFDSLRAEEKESVATPHQLRWTSTFESEQRTEKVSGSFFDPNSPSTRRFFKIMGEFMDLVNKEAPETGVGLREDFAERTEDLRWCKYHRMGTFILDFPEASECYSTLHGCITGRDLWPIQPSVKTARKGKHTTTVQMA